jgi:hypothetical protein
MQPIVISHTIQEFDGVRYYLCGKYFQRKGVRLHIQVWEHHNGPVPDGHHIHHRFTRDRNESTELECLTVKEHFGVHYHGKEFGERGRKYLGRARVAAAAWHASKQGRKWHSDNYEKHVRAVAEKRVGLHCKECGEYFKASYMRRNDAKFCSGRCKARDLRRRRKLAR